MRGNPASGAGAIVVVFTGDGELVFGQQVETSNNITGDVNSSLHVLFYVAFTMINEVRLFHKSIILTKKSRLSRSGSDGSSLLDTLHSCTQLKQFELYACLHQEYAQYTGDTMYGVVTMVGEIACQAILLCRLLEFVTMHS